MADVRKKFVTFLKNNWIKYLVQIVIALALSLAFMSFRGAFEAGTVPAGPELRLCVTVFPSQQ